MEFVEPDDSGYTIYSKSNCNYCIKIKQALIQKKYYFLEIQCDEYLIKNRDNFLSFIQDKIGKTYTTFPMVFYDGKFIGGSVEGIAHIEKNSLSFNDLF